MESPLPSTLMDSPRSTPRFKRVRSRTMSELNGWSIASGVFSGEEWAIEGSEEGSGGEGSSSFSSGSDSAYGTLDEGDSSMESSFSGLRRKLSFKKTGGQKKQRAPRSRSVGDSWRRAGSTSTLGGGPEGLFDVEYAGNDSFDDLLFSPGPSTPSTSSSRRSTPEPSECDFELRLNSAGAIMGSPSRRINHRNSDSSIGSPFLGRRHTVPRRKRHRTASISISLVSPSRPIKVARTETTSSPSLSTLSSPPSTSLPSLQLSVPPLTTSIAALSISVSLLSQFLPIPLLPASPVHLLHPGAHTLLEYTNVLLSPLLITPSAPSAALALANLASLKLLEEEVQPSLGISTRSATAVGVWSAVVATRVTLAWVFGRVLGWAHPEYFATKAIHEVGSGLAPLLLCLLLAQSYRRRETTTSLLSFQLVLLAANFSTPIEQGGSGFWWGLSGAFVGAVICVLLFAYESVVPIPIGSQHRPSKTGSDRSSAYHKFSPILTLLLLPLLASYNAPIVSNTSVDATFDTLHPSQPNLLTVLLMTAPRPGNPDFLLRTIDSWLSALPEPVAPIRTRSIFSRRTATPPTDITSRIRLIVYTHFGTHDAFDEAKSYFTTDSRYAAKAARYVEWYRDPRGKANRLDQRLHVARGLEYASRGGTSAYVMLTEDDFPLCPDAESGPGSRSWSHSWEELKRVLVATNEAMPDFSSTSTSPASPMSLAEQEATSGHCGLFAATGGSGLAVRGFIAAQLPGLLLGVDDPHGNKRSAKAERGEFSVKREDEGADTPDLVIQDCLRGRIAGCEVCAPPSPSNARKFPKGSARNPQGVLGDRWGKSGLAGTEKLLQHHLGYNASTLPGRRYGKEEWACGWRQPFNGEPDVLTF